MITSKDSWQCPVCGTVYDKFDDHCHDPECMDEVLAQELRDAEEAQAEDKAQEYRDRVFDSEFIGEF